MSICQKFFKFALSTERVQIPFIDDTRTNKSTGYTSSKVLYFTSTFNRNCNRFLMYVIIFDYFNFAEFGA